MDNQDDNQIPISTTPEPLPDLAAEPDVEAERQARLDYFRSVVPPPKQHKVRKIMSWILLVLIIAAVAFGGYWQFGHHKTTAKPANVSSSQSQTTAPLTNKVLPKVATKSYSSDNFMVTINYPEAWTYSDTPTDLSVTSPAMQITDATGAAVSGKIVMNMVPKGTLPVGFGSGATAVLDSVKVDYTQPTASQRASTYLSFAQYQATTVSGALDGIYVTGNYGYQKDQNIPSTDIANVDPLVTVTFEKCADTMCDSNLTPFSIKASDWQDANFSAPITTLLTSLAFN